MVNGSTVLTLPTQVLVRQLQDEMVLLDMASEQYFGLDPVGICVLEAIRLGSDVDGAVAAVLEGFDGTEQEGPHGCLRPCSNLVSNGLLAVISPSPDLS